MASQSQGSRWVLTTRKSHTRQDESIDQRTACNVAPVFLETKATVAKTIGLIREAASNKADLVVFPETHIPGYGTDIEDRPQKRPDLTDIH
jgi:apolipoprotein N-acyltransferase